ncbi:DUF3139 domain-containing protein [Bacillus sp. FJAT-52991]|uniref:DUF3139 domain-containing protein n=1 Tax=Bacillus kandeliae TaxID=3129297 RepID=A0ABZ2N345_9BACI
MKRTSKMKKAIITLFFIALIITVGSIGKKLYFAHYKKLADERIEKVIEFQGATLNNGKVMVDVYDSKNACWFKSIYFHDDPDITYEYEYIKSSNEVRVWAMYNNMSLDLVNKEAKYPLIDVYFDKEGNIIKSEKR